MCFVATLSSASLQSERAIDLSLALAGNDFVSQSAATHLAVNRQQSTMASSAPTEDKTAATSGTAPEGDAAVEVTPLEAIKAECAALQSSISSGTALYPQWMRHSRVCVPNCIAPPLPLAHSFCTLLCDLPGSLEETAPRVIKLLKQLGASSLAKQEEEEDAEDESGSAKKKKGKKAEDTIDELALFLAEGKANALPHIVTSLLKRE